MYKVNILIAVIAFFATFAASPPTDSESKGLEIAKQADLADRGFEDSKVNLTMILRNKRGQESKRLMTNRTLELDTDGDKSLITFQQPWRRQRHGDFNLHPIKKGQMTNGSIYQLLSASREFPQTINPGPLWAANLLTRTCLHRRLRNIHTIFLGEESLESANTLKVERFPLDPKSGYVRQIVWYSPEHGYRIEKVEFYDRKNAHLKTLTYHDYQLYAEKHWRAGEMHMVNHQTNKETQLIFEGYKLKNGLTENDFSQNSLKRAGK